ncbi:MAG: HEAT repeat domain-containing protein [Planctomycetota bacterium]|jgi:HEAT repeat protein
MRLGLVLLLACAACADKEAARQERLREASALVARLDQPDALARFVELGEVAPLLSLEDSAPEPIQRAACFALGRIGGDDARIRLEATVAGGGARPVRRAAFFALEDAGKAQAAWQDEQQREQEARPLIATLAEQRVLAQVVALRAVGPLLAATRPGGPQRVRRLACVALGRIGGDEARDRLLELLSDSAGEPEQYGPMRLYAAVGLTELNDPGTAIDLLLALSRINPDDNLAARAAEGQSGSYWTIDAQLCDALLGLGLWTAEEELIEQMGRRHYVRVLIDAHAVLRRRTGLELPFRYNGSYEDRRSDREAWRQKLSQTRAERRAKRPFAANDARFQRRLKDIMDWLGGQAVNYRYIARKVVERLGGYALPALTEALRSPNPSAQRQAALMLGRIGDPRAAPALRGALKLADADARSEAIDALVKLSDAEARPAVRGLLEDSDAEVRASAAQYLGRLGEAEDMDSLRQALSKERSPATETRLVAALLRLGDLSMAARLIEIFVDGEQHDREHAQEALEEAAGKRAGASATDPKPQREQAAREMAGWFR